MWFINTIIGIVFVILAGFLGYWVSDRSEPVLFTSVQAVTPIVEPGGLVRVRYEIERRRRTCNVHLEQIVFDSERTRYSAPDEDFVSSPGGVGNDVFVLEMRIPSSASEGPANYRGVRSFYCNPLHKWLDFPIRVVTPDVLFEIQRRRNDGQDDTPRSRQAP